MINLMQKKYVKKICVDKPQRDNFEIENLISSNGDDKLNFFSSSPNNGFAVDTFIRPPVNIQIDLTEPANIHTIILNGKVNSQISNGFTISTSTRSQPLKQVSKLVNHKQNDCYLYKFTRRNGKSSSSFEKSEPMNTSYFNANPLSLLNEAISISIGIIWTLNSSQPCLKSIKILGFLCKAEIECIDLSSSCDQVTNSEVERVKLPEEFIDELTHEAMRMPIRLPSNKLIDKCTLDRYLKELEKNKKQPQDPFTCKPFNLDYKPIIDEHLKSKIDRFYLDNKNHIIEQKHVVSKAKRPIESDQTTLTKRFKANQAISSSTAPISKNLSEKSIQISCNCCLNAKSGSKNLYQIIKCKHNFCRECLNVLNKVCIVCNVEFDNGQVINTDRLNLV